MALTHQYDEISTSWLRKDIQGYNWRTFWHDLSAGLTVAFLTVPQAMAYAMVAGLPLSCGILSAVFASIIVAIFGSSRHLVVGPSNAIAILIQAAISEILFSFYRDISGIERDLVAIQILTQLTLLVGVFQAVASVCKLGKLTQFVSHSVIVGYISGAALAVIITQMYTFLGVPALQGVYSLYQRAYYLLSHLEMLHGPTAMIGLASLLLLLIIKKLFKRIPAAVIVLIAAGVAVHVLGLSSYTETELFSPYEDEMAGKVTLIGDTEEIYGIFPTLSMPFFNTSIMNHLLPYAFAIAMLSVLETISVAKAIASNSGQYLSTNQEIFGLSLGNLLSSLMGAMPCSGSPSRSSLNYAGGAKTRFAAVFNSFFVVIILFAFGYFVNRIPLAALAALLLANSVQIVNMKQFLFCLKATRSDAFVLITTLLACMVFSLHIAFYIGIALSIGLYLQKAAVPHMIECTFDDSGKLENIDYTKRKQKSQIRMINVHGELFFGAADLFQTTLKTLTEDDHMTKVIILRLKNARDMDATACLALEQLYDYLKNSNRYLIACGLTQQSWEVLCDSGLVELIGKDNLFIFDEQHPNTTVQRALARAKFLIEKANKEEEKAALTENADEVPLSVSVEGN